MIGFLIIIGLVTFIDLSRYFLPDPVLTATTPPQFIQYFVFIVVDWNHNFRNCLVFAIFHLGERPSQSFY